MLDDRVAGDADKSTVAHESGVERGEGLLFAVGVAGEMGPHFSGLLFEGLSQAGDRGAGRQLIGAR